MFATWLHATLLTGLFAFSVTAADDPFIGKWKLNLAQSQLTGQVVEIQALPDNTYQFKEDEHTDVILADGLDHPTHLGETMAVMQKTPDTWAITYKQGDRVLMNTIWKVSKDGRSLTYVATGTRPNGQKFNNQLTAKRTSGKSGLAGTWKTTGVSLSSPREIYIAAYGSGGHLITFPGRKQTISMNFDSKEYAEEGPTVAEGSTSSGRRIDGRTIETTEKIKGKVIETAKATISDDGRTHTIVITEPDDPTPLVLVYRREGK